MSSLEKTTLYILPIHRVAVARDNAGKLAQLPYSNDSSRRPRVMKQFVNDIVNNPIRRRKNENVLSVPFDRDGAFEHIRWRQHGPELGCGQRTMKLDADARLRMDQDRNVMHDAKRRPLRRRHHPAPLDRRERRERVTHRL